MRGVLEMHACFKLRDGLQVHIFPFLKISYCVFYIHTALKSQFNVLLFQKVKVAPGFANVYRQKQHF